MKSTSTFLLLLVALFTLPSLQAQKANIVLTLKSPTKEVSITRSPLLPKSQTDIIETVQKIKKGKVEITVPQDQGYLFTIKPKYETLDPNTVRNIDFYYFPSDQLEVSATLKNDYPEMNIQGGLYDEFYTKAFPTYVELEKKFCPLNRQFLRTRASGSLFQSLEEQNLLADLNATLTKINIAKKEYIRNNPKSDVSAMFLIHIGPADRDFHPLYKSIDDTAKNGRFKVPLNFYAQILEAMEKQQQGQQQEK